jgi:hypothetical protein
MYIILKNKHFKLEWTAWSQFLKNQLLNIKVNEFKKIATL